jgi:hypothetical protein
VYDARELQPVESSINFPYLCFLPGSGRSFRAKVSDIKIEGAFRFFRRPKKLIFGRGYRSNLRWLADCPSGESNDVVQKEKKKLYPSMKLNTADA